MTISKPTDTTQALELAQRVLRLHDTEVDCEGCDTHLARLTELVVEGHDPCKVLPAVQAHLDHCEECREEFEALLAVVRAQAAGLC